ncbi:MAG TPA: hypothetical protein VF478_08220 [Anaerolineae bacterium]
MEKMLSLRQAQHGQSIKTYWFYKNDLCPCCAKRRVEIFKYKREDALSLNAFMYRELGVLIGYPLCGICASDLRNPSKKRQMLMNERIEQHLIEAYQKHMLRAN